ncbi:MAG: hypothetical protein OK449_08680 [Thaumarchaeota archaeon]|nr:hypothetical protein [Nitrososphaerota archaeon]
MTVAVVTGSNNDARFAVTDFTLAKPATVFVNPGFPVDGPPLAFNGCVVACSRLYTHGDQTGSVAVVGQYSGGYVAIYDVSNPATPAEISTFDTTLGAPNNTGIGAISLYGTNLLVGELAGPNMVLIDITNQKAPKILSTFTDKNFSDGGISAIVLNGSTAVAAGTFSVDVIDYTRPHHPAWAASFPEGLSPPHPESPLTVDYDGESIAVGDGDGNVYLFEFYGGALHASGQSSSGLIEGITSIAVMTGEVVQVAVGEVATESVNLITFGSPSAPIATIEVSNGAGADPGGPLTFYGLPNLFAGTNDGQGVTWFNTSTWPNWPPAGVPKVSVAKKANLAPASVSTLGVAAFPTPSAPRPPHLPRRRGPPAGSGGNKRPPKRRAVSKGRKSR